VRSGARSNVLPACASSPRNGACVATGNASHISNGSTDTRRGPPVDRECDDSAARPRPEYTFVEATAIKRKTAPTVLRISTSAFVPAILPAVAVAGHFEIRGTKIGVRP